MRYRGWTLRVVAVVVGGGDGAQTIHPDKKQAKGGPFKGVQRWFEMLAKRRSKK